MHIILKRVVNRKILYPSLLSTLLIPAICQASISESAAARFLNQTTFGANRASITELVNLGSRSDWIDRQMDSQQTPVSDISTYTMANGHRSSPTVRDFPWMHNAIYGPDQLRQRVAFALSEIFVISDIDYTLKVGGQYGVVDYYDMLSRSAFGNYRDLLEDVTLHPTMGIYLSMVGNQQADPANNIRPDENFAREVLQLFSIGPHQLHNNGNIIINNDGEPCSTYDNNIVTNFARVFTGWNFTNTNVDDWVPNDYTAMDVINPMVNFQAFHDTGAKRLLNNRTARTNNGCRAIDNGRNLPARNGANAAINDLNAALDNISNHPNVPPFFSKALIQRLTTSNPSPQYITRVARVFKDNGQSVRGDLGAVIKAILLDPEAINGTRRNPDFGKLREPIMLQSQLWRAMDIVEGFESRSPEGPIRDQSRFQTIGTNTTYIEEVLGQAYLRSPSVFNFFLPSNPLPKVSQELLSPESQLYTEGAIARMNENFYGQIYYQVNANPNSRPYLLSMNIDELLEMASTPSKLVYHLNLVLLGGKMEGEFAETLRALVRSYPGTDAGRAQAVIECLYIITASPAYRVQL